MTAPPQDLEPKRSRWFSELSRGAKWLVGVILVALVGAVVTAVVATWFPPGELSAALSDVSIDRNVTLAEFTTRERNDHASTRRRSAATVRLAAYVIAQGTGEETASPEETSSPDETASPEETDTPPASVTPDSTTRAEDPLVDLKLTGRAQERLDTGVSRALDDPRVPDLDLGTACTRDVSSSECGLRSLQLQLQMVEEDGTQGAVRTATVARRLVKIFRGTRTRRPASGHGKREPVGVTINFNASLTGFSGKRVDIRWSLYNATSRSRVPHDWLTNQRVLIMKGKADKHTRSGQFWVPIPKAKGPYFIRIGAYDEDDTRLDYANTPKFR